MQSERASLPRRIAVVGVTGSGKTTLARELAARLGYVYIELDALHWMPNWVEAPTDQFRQALTTLLKTECWVVDGNYSKARDLIWTQAEMLIWLDYPLPLILWRLWLRTWRRIRSKERLWNGNHERWQVFLSRDSLFLWAVQSQRKHRRTYPALLTQAEYAHLRLVRLHSPAETQRWLDNFP
jgi:adenylate kinase family enzyme